jgi:hypothetical protein
MRKVLLARSSNLLYSLGGFILLYVILSFIWFYRLFVWPTMLKSIYERLFTLNSLFDSLFILYKTSHSNRLFNMQVSLISESCYSDLASERVNLESRIS